MNTCKSLILAGFLAIAALPLAASRAAACGGYGSPAEMALMLAESPDGPTSADGIQCLRALGYEGLEEVLVQYDAEFPEVDPTIGNSSPFDIPSGASFDPYAASDVLKLAESERQNELRTLIDAVAGQRDAAFSRLYWYTDLDEAKAAAAREDKPILCLRMLGNLTDEVSCANSRFFRTTLYPNAQISDYLRANFILHWQSVRPVPTITVDYGDGRRIERTITGNSAHYILDRNGRIVDAIPGLYGANEFLEKLTAAHTIASTCGPLAEHEFATALTSYHENALNAATVEFRDDLVASGMGDLQDVSSIDATWAGELDKGIWKSVADRHADSVNLDESATRLISLKTNEGEALSDGEAAMNRAMSKMAVESPMMAMMRNLRSSIALDTVKNEFLFHREIHQWLAANPTAYDVNSFNTRVYDELFKTPESDPWMGMNPPDVFAALPDNGIQFVSTSIR